MGRMIRRMFEEDTREPSNDEMYNIAYRKVKKIKGFYSHLRVYIIVNIIIIISSLNRTYIGNHFEIRGFLDWETYSTAFFWGIALAVHAFTVFTPDLFFNKDWEQKKIQKYMEKEKQNTSKWE